LVPPEVHWYLSPLKESCSVNSIESRSPGDYSLAFKLPAVDQVERVIWFAKERPGTCEIQWPQAVRWFRWHGRHEGKLRESAISMTAPPKSGR